MKPHLAPVETSGSSPFDAIKNTSPDGAEYWSARDLMPLMGYDKWERFAGAVDRARTSIEVQGMDPEAEASRLREPSGKTNQLRDDYHLSRFAAYLVAMNGDPRKPEVAAAQAYFAIRTYQDETRSEVPAIPEDYVSALRELADQFERAEFEKERADFQEQRAELEARRAAELSGPAASWEAFVSPEGDFSVSEAAKMLSRDPRIEIGRDRLFRFMHELGWIYRTTGHRSHWEARQDRAIRTGRLAHKAGSSFVNEHTGRREQAHPTVRVTLKGLHELQRALTEEKGALL